MAKQTINIGTNPNDGTGTPIRTAFNMINDNFTELYNQDTISVSQLKALALESTDFADFQAKIAQL